MRGHPSCPVAGCGRARRSRGWISQNTRAAWRYWGMVHPRWIRKHHQGEVVGVWHDGPPTTCQPAVNPRPWISVMRPRKTAGQALKKSYGRPFPSYSVLMNNRIKRGRGERGEKNTCDNWFRSNYPVAWGTRRTGLIEREHKWESADIIKDRCRERVLRSLMTLDTQKAASGGDALSNGLGLLWRSPYSQFRRRN